MTNIAIEKNAIEIVSFPMNSMVILHSKLLVYQRVICSGLWDYDGNIQALCSGSSQGSELALPNLLLSSAM